jgi:hypothetical protein
MSARQKIEAMIRQKEQELEELNKEIELTRTYIAALHDVMKVLPRDKAAMGSNEGLLRAGSAVAEARNLIRDEGHPLHVDVLLRRMGKPLTRESRASLAGSIAAYVRREEIFTRPAPNTFGLIEMEQRQPDHEEEGEGVSGEVADAVPPEDFGTDRPAREMAFAGLS